MAGVGNIEVVVESCSVMKVPGLERHLLRNEDYSRRREGESVLTSGDISLLVVDSVRSSHEAKHSCYVFLL